MVARGELEVKLEEALRGRKQTAILGIGNELGGDDSLGLLAAKAINKSLTNLPQVRVLLAGTAPENFTGTLRRLSPSHVILIDAAEMGEKAGTIKLIEPGSIGKQTPSTHSIPLYVLVEYIEKEIGSEVIILGIQPKDTTSGTPVSREARRSANRLALMLRQVLRDQYQTA